MISREQNEATWILRFPHRLGRIEQQTQSLWAGKSSIDSGFYLDRRLLGHGCERQRTKQ